MYLNSEYIFLFIKVKLTITRALPAKLSQKFYWVEENDKYGKLLGVLNKLFKIETSKIIIFANNKSTCNNVNCLNLIKKILPFITGKGKSNTV